MSQEALMSLAKALESNSSMRDQFLSESTLEGRARVASEHGFKITVQDLEALFGAPGDVAQTEMSEAELGSVAGGAGIVKSPLRTILICSLGCLTINSCTGGTIKI
jgi:predicted ribosomally synthesized peptide with nif11-like leader